MWVWKDSASNQPHRYSKIQALRLFRQLFQEESRPISGHQEGRGLLITWLTTVLIYIQPFAVRHWEELWECCSKRPKLRTRLGPNVKRHLSCLFRLSVFPSFFSFSITTLPRSSSSPYAPYNSWTLRGLTKLVCDVLYVICWCLCVVYILEWRHWPIGELHAFIRLVN